MSRSPAGGCTIIHVSAVVLRDARGRILMVRKRGTSMWMNPGGKPEPGESAGECAAREVQEELGLRLDAARLLSLGEFAAPAANEAGHTVVADVFDWPEAVAADVAPTAEIEETRWVTTDDLGDETLAPLFVDHIVPAIGLHVTAE
ncbi:MAG: NUDIX domain-containing protein [Tessaracoccus sp.]|uniref:NUDIX hydrolase n=1 Tax=Tessaracoccus sp. TaxID=1971211 RepID=UPI001EB268CD|nr:NUDIX domain-containing protein [Tessaracoccus sp.]MBK7821243.1 NUDIX domain-containing protein [Tessaracoccus sp.]